MQVVSGLIGRQTVHFEAPPRQVLARHAQIVLSERRIKALNRLLDAGPGGFEGGLNARKYMGITHVSKATATCDLADLVDKECLLRRSGGGRSASYDIVWP